MPESIRIAMVTDYPTDTGRISGGVQAVSYRLAAELSRIPGVELHVIHCHSDVVEAHTEIHGSLIVHYRAQTRKRIIPNMMTGVNIIADMLREIRPDAVHAHGPSLAVAALRAGYNPLWTIHGVLRQEAPLFKGAFNRLSFALAQYYEAIALRRVGWITGVSRYVVGAYSGRSRARWSVVENPADSSFFGLDREPQPGRVLVPAAVIPRKDQLSLVRAAAIIRRTIPALSMHFAGSLSDTAYVREVLQEIDRAGLRDTVTLLGPLSADELREEYRSASLVALASRQESAPMAIIEAMAAGLPVVATNAGGVPDMIQDSVTGFVVPRNDPDALAEKAATLLGSPARAAEFGTAAASQARSRFASARIAEQYLALYRKIAGNRIPDKAMG